MVSEQRKSSRVILNGTILSMRFLLLSVIQSKRKKFLFSSFFFLINLIFARKSRSGRVDVDGNQSDE